MMENDKKPTNPNAFPNVDPNYFGATDGHGMSLRDYFANSAMQGLLGNLAIQDKVLAIKQREYWAKEYGFDATEAQCLVKESFLIADEMLKQREL